MQERGLIKGIRTVIEGEVSIVPLLGLTSTIEDTILVGLGGSSLLIITSFIVYLFGKWFLKVEALLLTVSIAGLCAGFISNISPSSKVEFYFTIMVVSTVYFLAKGSNNYTQRISLEWGLGIGVGFGLMAFIVGLLRNLLPSSPGFAFMVLALVIASGRKLLSLNRR